MNISLTFEPINADAHLSGKTLLHHHRLISSILQTAVQWQVIIANPCDRVKAPRAESAKPKFLDEVGATQLLEFLDYEDDIQFVTAIKLSLYTGFRRGELCGLEWSDIDLEKNIIHICRSSLYLPDRGIYTDETKNETSTRTIKVPLTVIATLNDYKTWQTEYRTSVGDQWIEHDRLFTSWNGLPIHPDTLTGKFKKFIKKYNLPPINIHSLRHTNATLQIAGGVNLVTVAKRLGHANAATTTKIYAHAIRSADAAASEVLENILSPVNHAMRKSGESKYHKH